MGVKVLLSGVDRIQIEFNAVKVHNRSEIAGCFDLKRYDDSEMMLVFGFTQK